MPKLDYIASLLLNALRKYDIKDVIIGGDKDCKHEFISKNDHSSTSNIGVVGNKEARAFSSSSCIHCQAWKGQYGLEPTPFGNEHSYVEHTRLWAKEAWRVLRNDGIMMLNLADSYAGSGGAGGDYNKGGLREGQEKYKQNKVNYPSKCQLLIPHRVAIALVDDGWVLRNTIIWHKTNAMPESVTDRFSKKYEYIFMFTKQEKYYFDLYAVREPHTQAIKDGVDKKEMESAWKAQRESKGKVQLDNSGKTSQGGTVNRNPLYYGNINGKNPGDAWQIPTSPSSEKHFAMWPERLVERMIRCSTRQPREIGGELLIDAVLDPFCGSGTTLKVAQQLCREPLGIDLGYHEMSKRRTSKIQKRLFI